MEFPISNNLGIKGHIGCIHFNYSPFISSKLPIFQSLMKLFITDLMQWTGVIFSFYT